MGMDAKELAEAKAIRDEAAESKLLQQKLAAFRPLVTPLCISLIFAGCALFFLLMGGLILGASNNVYTISIARIYRSVLHCARFADIAIKRMFLVALHTCVVGCSPAVWFPLSGCGDRIAL